MGAKLVKIGKNNKFCGKYTNNYTYIAKVIWVKSIWK